MKSKKHKENTNKPRQRNTKETKTNMERNTK